MTASGPGALYIIATPIGNLEDMTFRAVRVLREVDLVACEDTRHSRILLDHYGIKKPLISYYREREAERCQQIMERLQAGDSVALVTDAGTPLISDPGARLVEAAAAAGIAIVPLPGASAALAAIMASGLPGDQPLAVLGFLPQRSGPRRAMLTAWAGVPACLVLFEAPHRLSALLDDMAACLGPARPLVVTRELTKLHEEFLRGTIATAREHFGAHPPRGEFTLVAGTPMTAPAPAPAGPGPVMSRTEFKRWAREQGLGRDAAYRQLQELRGKIKLDGG